MGKKRKIEFAWLPRIPTSSRPPKSSPPSRTVTSKPWEEFPKTNTHPDKNEAYRAYIEARDRERERERQMTWLHRWQAAPRPAQPEPTTTTFFFIIIGPPLARSARASALQRNPLPYREDKHCVVAGSVSVTLQQPNDIVFMFFFFWVINSVTATLGFPLAGFQRARKNQ